MAYARPLALLIAFFVTAWIWFFADEKWLVIFPLAAAVVIGLFPVLRRIPGARAYRRGVQPSAK